MQLQLLYTNYTTPQLQLHYTTATTTAAQHHTTSSSCGWCPLQPLHPFQQTQLQPPFNPSMDLLCHPWFTATNLSYRFPIFETSAAALCGTTGKRFELYIRHYILCIYIYIVKYYRGKFRSQNSDSMDRWKSRGGKSQKREEKRRREKIREEKEPEERRRRCAER